jgi:cytidylate kinase
MSDAIQRDVITMDGPAASGKSSVARRVAGRLGRIFVGTGSMYRAVTWALLDLGIDPEDATAVAEAVRGLQIEFPVAEGEARIAVNGRVLDAELTSDAVNQAVSFIARVPQVRDRLVAGQRSLAGIGPLVMEGRDIGSVVFPDAAHKFYIDASEEVRSRRRHAQGHKDSVTERDRLDSTRKTSPLVIAKDAIVIDSSDLSLDEVVDAVLAALPAHAPTARAG